MPRHEGSTDVSEEDIIEIRTKSEIENIKQAAKNRNEPYKRQAKAHRKEEDTTTILEHMRMNDGKSHSASISIKNSQRVEISF